MIWWTRSSRARSTIMCTTVASHWDNLAVTMLVRAFQPTRKPCLSAKKEWLCRDGVSLSFPDANTCRVNCNPSKMPVYRDIVKSIPLQNQIHTFNLFGVYPTNTNPLLAISDQVGKISFPQTICSNSLVTLTPLCLLRLLKMITQSSQLSLLQHLIH